MKKQGLSRETVLSFALNGSRTGITGPDDALAQRADVGEIEVERDIQGKPHKGKVLAVIHAHLNDVTDYASGTVAKLINEAPYQD